MPWLVKRIFQGTLPLIVLLSGLILGSCGGSGSSVPEPVAGNPPTQPPTLAAQFTEITDSTGIGFSVGYSKFVGSTVGVSEFAGGVASGDYDNDGDVDLFVVRGDVGPNLLYRNDGDNIFSERAVEAGVAFTKSATENYRHSGPMFADMDGDGDLDLFLGGVHGDPIRIYANDGDGSFSDVSNGSGLEALSSPNTISAAFGDYDLDGDLDLLLSHWGTTRLTSDPGDTEHLWRNESIGTTIRFVSVSVEANISPSIISLADPHREGGERDNSLTPTFARINNDLFPDILMASDFNTSMVFVNNGDGTFANTTDTNVITDTNGMGSAVGDYDNDGDLDWFVTSIRFENSNNVLPNGNRLYLNEDGEFRAVTEAAGAADGGWGWGACFLDLDNDGFLDIYHTNGWRTGGTLGNFAADTGRAFLGSRSGTFEDVADTIGLIEDGQGRGLVCADFDRDGDTDIFLWSNEAPGGGRFFRNDSSLNNYLRVSLEGVPPNTFAAGARVSVSIGTHTQMREIMFASNFISQNPTEQVFGLGSAGQVDSLHIEWPDGKTTDKGIVAANQTLVIIHPDR